MASTDKLIGYLYPGALLCSMSKILYVLHLTGVTVAYELYCSSILLYSKVHVKGSTFDFAPTSGVQVTFQ